MVVRGAVKIALGLVFGLWPHVRHERACGPGQQRALRPRWRRGAKLGTLVNPYQAKEDAHDQALADEGHKLFGNYGCPGCHGFGGGGGMCPPITNGVWIYGDKDDTLFRLVALGSAELQSKYGLTRQATENIVAPMPADGLALSRRPTIFGRLSPG